MAIRKGALILTDSLGLGVGGMSSVPDTDFNRWTGEDYPTSDPEDVDIPDVEVLTCNLPYGDTASSRVSGSAAGAVTVEDNIFDGTGATDDHQWVYIRSGLGQGQRRAITSPTADNIAAITPSWTTQPDASSILEFWKDSYSSSGASTTDSNKNTTEIAKDNGTTPDFSSADVGKWLVVADSSVTGLQGAARRISEFIDADTVKVSPAMPADLADNDCFRVMTGTSLGTRVDALTDITSSNCSLQPMRFYQDTGATTYSDPHKWPNWYGIPQQSPAQHASNDSISFIPELAWQLRAFSSGKTHVVNVGQGGATLAPQNVESLATLTILNPYSWGADLKGNDFRAGGTNNLLDAALLQVTALKTLVATAGDTLNIDSVYVVLGTNDALNEDKANQFKENMRNLRRYVRQWLEDNEATQVSASNIKWCMATAATSRTYASTVNDAIAEVAGDDINSGYVDITNFSFADGVHLDQTGAIELGAAFGALYDSLQMLEHGSTTQREDRYTLAEIKTQVTRRWERSDSNMSTADDHLLLAINQALFEIYRTFGDSAYFLRHAEEMTLAGSTYPGTVVLPRKVRRPLKISYQNVPGSTVIWKGIRHTSFGTEITVHGAGSGPYLVHYIAMPTELAKDEDQPLIPREHTELLVLLACQRLASTSGSGAINAQLERDIVRCMKYVWRDVHRYDRMRQESMTAIDSYDSWRNGPSEDWLATNFWGR